MNPDPDDVTFQFNQIQLSPPEVKEKDDADVSFGFNLVNGDSKSSENSPENWPENDDVEDEEDGVTFNTIQVQIGSKSQQFTPENADVAGEGDGVDEEDNDVTFNTSQVELDSESQQVSPENLPENDDVDNEDDDVDVDGEGEDDDVDEEDDGDDVEGEEFTFMCINSDNSITELTEKTVFPLFDQSLLYNSFNNQNNEDGKSINDIPVSNVFIESPRDATSSSSPTTLTAITDSNEMNIKSNSTGFSKLWRFRDNNNINRSNSDGRDAFVFLNPKTEGKGKGKVVSEGVVKKKVKKANVSAHEVYLKKAKGGGEEERRKSYLPYRPGLMGFFTNVNGGLSKNVHPF